MAIYDVNAAIEKPNLVNSFRQGQAFGQQQRAYQQQQADQNAFRQLAPAVIAGDPNAYAEAAVIDPNGAQAYQAAGDSQLRRLEGAIKLIDSATDPRQKEAYYQQVRPYLSRLSPNGVEPPMTFAEAEPKMEEARARIAMLGQEGQQGAVQSTYVDAQGNRVAVMRDGTTQILGGNAPVNQIIDTGNGFYGVNKGSLQAAPVMVGGQAQQGSAMPNQPTPPRNEDAIFAQANQMAAGGVPDEQVQAWLNQQLGAAQILPAAPQGQQLVSAPKPVAEPTALQLNADARDQARLELARRAAALAEQKATAAPAMTAAAQKDMLARKAKQPQVANLSRGLQRIENALNALNKGGMADTGPLDQYAQRYTQAGKELEAAIGGIQNSLLSLTRVPGIGSQSDLEARIASLQYPSLDQYPENNRRTLENLKAFAQDLQEAYRLADQADSANAAPASGGWSIRPID